MKRIKNDWLVIIGSLLLMITAFIACSKKDTPIPSLPKATITSFSPTTAYTGDTITITGTNFTGATAVTFGGTAAASFKVISATSIIAVVGTGTSGSVGVTISGGTGTLAGFVYNSGLPPVDGYGSSNDVEPASLIAYWPFEGNATEKVHAAVPALTGGGATSYVAGRIGQAIHLDSSWITYGPNSTSASADNTTFGSNDTLQNGFTISLWAQVAQTETLSTLLQFSSPNIPNWPLLGIQYRKHADNSFDFDGGFSNVDSAGPHIAYAGLFKEPAFMDTLTWAFVSMTYDASAKSLKYYANGQLVNTIDLLSKGLFPNPAEPLLLIAPNYPSIGAAEGKVTTPTSVNDPAGYMAYGIKGNVDDIRVFNKTLTDKQISDLYILGNQGR